MKKDLILFSLLLTAVMFSGCAGGMFSQRYYCNKSTANDGGRLTEGYMPSNGVGPQFMNNTAPYSGAPVKVVNGSDMIYGAAPDKINAENNAEAAKSAQYAAARAGMDPNAFAAGYDPNSPYYYATGNGAYGGMYGARTWGTAGRLDDGIARRAWGGRRIGTGGMAARRNAQYEEQIWNRMNPYDHPNTPTRSPRDFFAPNPPSIGP